MGALRHLSRLSRRFDLRRLHKSEGGNVIVMYIAAALLLVGMLWAVIGTGARLVQKETLQSSADAAAFSAAVIKAKGMNIIAFCNLLMALLLAIIIILRLLKDALILAGVLLTVASFFQPELAALAAEVDNIASRFNDAEKKIEDGITQAMKGIGKFERGVAKVTPALALVEAYRVGTDGAYKANFGSQELYTIALPLPLGADLSLPVKDGTWSTLCDHAKDTIGKILDTVLKVVVGDSIASYVSDAMQMIAGPFESAVCGGGGGAVTSKPIKQVVTDCNECLSADPPATDTKWQDGGVVLKVNGGFPESGDCGGAEIIVDGVDHKNAQFVSCVMEKTKDLSGASSDVDKVLPLELADDWKQHTQVRAFTVLPGTRSHERRRSVGVGKRGGADGDPNLIDALLTMSQAEYCSWNNHDDLWHMDWRARLVPFTVGSDHIGGSTGDSTGTVQGAGVIQSKMQSFFGSEAGQTFMKQFLIH